MEPHGYLVHVMWRDAHHTFYGPFADTNESMAWIMENVPATILFETVPVFADIRGRAE